MVPNIQRRSLQATLNDWFLFLQNMNPVVIEPPTKAMKKATVRPQAAAVNSVVEAFTEFKHLLLPITDRNPYLSEGTRQLTNQNQLGDHYGSKHPKLQLGHKLLQSIQLLRH